MKKKSNIIAFVFVIATLFVAVLSHKIILSLGADDSKSLCMLHFGKDIIFILAAGLILRYVILRNDEKNGEILKKLTDINNEIRDSNERYDIVAKATSDTIWDWKIQEDKFFWNKGIFGIYGYAKEEVGDSSKWWFDRIHPEDSMRVSVSLYSFLEQKTERWQDEYRFMCADGSYRFVFDRGFLVKDEQGNAVRMIGAMQDVTKQKQEEQRLRLLETVVTQTKDAVVITDKDLQVDEFPNILFVNPSFTTITGFKPKEVVGKTLNLFNGPKSDLTKKENLIESIKNFDESTLETVSYTKDGKKFWINLTMIPVTNTEGEYTHWICIIRDITEEKNQEKEKEQLIRELTKNNRDLKQFSYITSHNFRAPLSNLTGLLALLEDIPIENEELKEILNGFHKSTRLLNETIEDLVKVVIIKDNPSIQKEEVVIKEVFENVFFQLNNQITLQKPNLKLDIDPKASLWINKSYLESIILNLLTNSLKYRSQNRPLKINMEVKEDEKSLLLTIRDNGIGIDMTKNRDKIFGLYQRFHNYADSKGLGLYLVKSQVEAMGGTIEVDSEVDKGTEFRINFIKV
ncbi:MAG: sensor histidine kinase [Flavobacterium sp.]